LWKNADMDIAVIKKLFFAVVVMLLGITAASAGPPDGGRGMPGAPNDFRQNGGNGFGAGRPPAPPPDQDANQRRGKLSADERRELRRQIDEAGQDIYRVKR
jgi:hypothetical protein